MERLKIDDFKNYNFLSQLKYSPNGVCKSVVAKKANDKNGYDSVIYVDKDNGFYPLTNKNGNVGPYIWLDDENILFSEIRCPKKKEEIAKGYEYSSFHKINVHGGEAIEEFTVMAKVNRIESLDTDQYLLRTTYNNNLPELEGKTKEEAEKLLGEYKKEQDYQVVDELPYWSNGNGFVNKLRSRLYTYTKNESLKPVTGKLDMLGDHVLSPCKKHVVYTKNNVKNDIREVKDCLYLYDFESGKETELLDNKYYIKEFDFYKDNLVIALSEGKKYNFHEHPSIYMMNLESKKLNELITLDMAVCSGAGSDCSLGGGNTYKVYGDDLYFTALQGFHGDVNKLSLKDKTLEIITPKNGNVYMFDISEKGFMTVAMCDDRLQEVYTCADKQYSKISEFNECTHKNKKYSKPVYLPYTNKDGIEIDGWAVLPIDYDPNKKYPAILDIHGGPKSAYGDTYFHEMQYWAAEGYFVFFSNPRGSDGKGNVFSEVRGLYGTIDYDDIMGFLDHMIATYPQVDVDNIGVTGGSYGGFMTNWIVGHTDRFKAAASQRSISNWISFSNICDIGYYFGPDQMQADTWSNHEKMWEHSPLKYANNVKTPILFIHSDEDYRCWIQEAYQMFTAVKLHGAESRMCIFHGENHELSRSGKPDHRERRLKEITLWMDKYLK